MRRKKKKKVDFKISVIASFQSLLLEMKAVSNILEGIFSIWCLNYSTWGKDNLSMEISAEY